jgi:hypothetical protein
MTSLTRAAVQAALSRDPVHDDAGYHCQICDRAFPRKSNMGVHQLTHRRDVGLAPTYPTGGRGKLPRRLTCRYEGCREILNRSSLFSHLTGGRHNLSRDEASFYVRKRSEESRAERLHETGGQPTNAELELMVPAVIEPEPEPILSDLEATEAVTAMLRVARIDGLIPVLLIPDLYELIQHAERVLQRLAELSQ